MVHQPTTNRKSIILAWTTGNGWARKSSLLFTFSNPSQDEYADERKTLSFNDKRELHRRFGDSISAILKSNASMTMKEVIKNLKKEKTLSVLDVPTTTSPSDNTSTALPSSSLSRHTPTILPRNALPPLSQNILKHSFDIYETSYEMDWALWNFDITINNINIECVLMSLHEKLISHFEVKMQEYKPKKALSVEVMRILKTFNVTSLEDLEKVLDEIKIDYNNLNRDIIYLRRLFEKLDLPEGWYNSHIIAPIFDDCLESIDECIF
ncbi:1566_t:CDS:2 [Funneliformis mosseae]|uniref:1566_t:CDS:1 n=1 Tax=Funneliformis mosseae TaxID=27381 RepID=A0A9N9CWM9_FUNMO|nr:1566_t:CDS:2 [Funneliformis mosseae]